MHAGVFADRNTTRAQEAVDLLAAFLYAETQSESVRTREAIAATVANQVRRLEAAASAESREPRAAISLRSRLFIECIQALTATAKLNQARDDPLYASCVRIAHRAVSGALQDPTYGALRFHKLGKRPAWARNLSAAMWIGSYLFYLEADDGTHV